LHGGALTGWPIRLWGKPRMPDSGDSIKTSADNTKDPRIFTEDYYRRIYEVEERHWWHRGMRYIADALLDPFLPHGKRLAILDAGCGTGGTFGWLERKGVSGFAVGVDFSEHALSFCRKRSHAPVGRASAVELPFAAESFDLITCVDVLQHLPALGGDLAAVKEFSRTLKPGGLVFVRTNAAVEKGTLASGAENYRKYAMKDIESLMTASGLDVLRLTRANWLLIFTERLSQAIGRGQRKSQACKDHGLTIRLLPPWLGWLNELLAQVLHLEAICLKQSDRSFTKGRSTMCVARKPFRVG